MVPANVSGGSRPWVALVHGQTQLHPRKDTHCSHIHQPRPLLPTPSPRPTHRLPAAAATVAEVAATAARRYLQPPPFAWSLQLLPLWCCHSWPRQRQRPQTAAG